MASLTPITAITSALPVAESVFGVLRRQSRDDAAATLAEQRLKADAKAQARQEDRDLRRKLAAQRARFAAQGRASESGSASTILRNLLDESSLAASEDAARTQSRIDELRQKNTEQTEHNLLELGRIAGGIRKNI